MPEKEKRRKGEEEMREQGIGDRGQNPNPQSLIPNPCIESAKHDSAERPQPRNLFRLPKRIWLIGIFAALAALIFTPLLMWSQRGKTQARSLSNLRRIAQGTLLYAQDWDGRTMPFVQKLPNGSTLTWAQTLQGYGVNPDVFTNPANPLSLPLPSDPKLGTTVNTAYALNKRLWDTFASGAFPLDNLEMPERTVLAVEAGNAWSQPDRMDKPSAFASLTYGDTTDRIQGFVPFISPHNGKMAVVAADGHTVLIKVAHYNDSLPHDTLYGRLGGNIYNWNGGYLNGQTDKPNKE